MSKFIKEYFNFSRREKNGILILILILIILIVSRLIIDNYKSTKTIYYDEFENEIDNFLSSYKYEIDTNKLFAFDPNFASKEELTAIGLSEKAVNGIIKYREEGRKFYKKEDVKKIRNLTDKEYELIKDYITINFESLFPTYKRKTYSTNKAKYRKSEHNKTFEKIEYFDFDPNTASKEDFIKLGLQPWQADNIIKYRNKGGKYKTKEDFEKVYGLKKEDFEKLQDYIKINKSDSTINIAKSHNTKLIININTADALELQKLNGIGPSYSKRIIEYRTKLGGFINVEQLLEVYGLDEELFEKIKNNISISSDFQTTKIDLNQAEYRTLIKHPYFNKEEVTKILSYRKFAGKIKSLDEMVKQKAISQEFANKISPYIYIEQ